MMTSDSSKHNKADPECDFDPFAEPKAMSVGWVLSGFPAFSGAKTNGGSLRKTPKNSPPRTGTELAESGQANPVQSSGVPAFTDTQTETQPEVDFDPFPEPRTVPANWNVSALL